jgi:3D (Asp-Asp-Asp) domain-containing protein/lysophospholipase L1-like esterase
MAAPAAAVAAKVAARAAAGALVNRASQTPGRSPPPKDGDGTLMTVIAIAVAVVLLPALIVVVLFGAAQPAVSCDAGAPLPAAWTGPGSLGGVAGTGVTRAELAAARQIRGAGGTRLTAGTYSPTAYFPNPHAPATNCASTCVSTASGIRVDNATRRAYLIASNPHLNQYGALAYVWPNPYGWNGPFVVADTGSAFHGAGRLDFYIFIAAGESWQQALARAYQWGLANQVGLSAAPIRPGGPTIGSPLGLGPADLRPAGAAPAPMLPRAAARVDDSSVVLNLGDSLAVSSSDQLQRQLAGRSVRTLAAAHRTSTQGLAVLRSVAHVPSTLVVQLGSSDTTVRRFARSVRAIVTLARRASARVLWVTIARPALHAVTDARLNAILRVEAARHANLQLVDWNAAVATGRVQLTDGVHPTAADYRVRAQLIADAVTDPAAIAVSACGAPLVPGSLGELAGTPEQIVNRVVLYAHEHGFPAVTPASVRAANDAHSALTSAGFPSDHKGPPDHAWAADISNASSPTPQMDALAATIATAFHIPWEGSGLVNHTAGGYRMQLIYRAAGHFDHVHFGVKRLAV